MGSKNRHATELLAVMRPWLNKAAVFVEPFCGGCNITDKLRMPRQASDKDTDLINLWQAVSRGWLPNKEYTEAQYYQMRDFPEKFCPAEVGYAKFALSYAGKPWGGWCRDSMGKRNYSQEAYRNAVKQFPHLLGVQFTRCDYSEVLVSSNAVIYCDPPYENTTSYKHGIHYEDFWGWATAQNVPTFVSSYQARPGWVCLWSKEVVNSLTRNTGASTGVERLYLHEKYYKI